MLFGEKTSSCMLEIEHSHDLAFVNQRDRKLRARFRIGLNIARILGYIGNEDGFLGLGSLSHKSATQGYLVLEMSVLIEAQRKTMLQFLAGGVEQQDAEHLVIDQPPHQFADASQQLIQIQYRGQF